MKTELVLGDLRVPIKLTPVSGKAKAPYETRQVCVECRGRGWHEAIDGGEPVACACEDGRRWAAERDRIAAASAIDPLAVTIDHDEPPTTTIQEPLYERRRGVWRGGEWVDLTDRLAAIDEATRIDGMQVLGSVTRGSVPVERIRDAHYISAAASRRALTLLWVAMRRESKDLVVKWTPRTTHRLGVLVAQGRSDRPALVLIDVEWADAVRPVPDDAVLQPVPLNYDMGAAGASACRMVRALHRSPVVFWRAHDEREAARRQLVEAARDGRLDGHELPTPEVVQGDGALEVEDFVFAVLRGQT